MNGQPIELKRWIQGGVILQRREKGLAVIEFSRNREHQSIKKVMATKSNGEGKHQERNQDTHILQNSPYICIVFSCLCAKSLSPSYQWCVLVMSLSYLGIIFIGGNLNDQNARSTMTKGASPLFLLFNFGPKCPPTCPMLPAKESPAQCLISQVRLAHFKNRTISQKKKKNVDSFLF